MKKIILLLLLAVLLTACPSPQPEVTPEPTAAPTPEPIQPPEPIGNVLFALFDGTTMKLWDGTRLVNAYQGKVTAAEPRKVAINDVLYYFDDYGQSAFSRYLPEIPTALATKPTAGQSKASTVYEDDIYTLVDIPPMEAYELGALPRHYTRIYENGIEVGQWNLHEWEVKDVIITASGHVLAIDAFGNFHNLTDSKDIYQAYQDGIMVYNWSDSTFSASIADETGEYDINWTNGYFHHSRWQKANDIWYTENGFTWSNTVGLRQATNALYNWNEYDNYPESYDGIYPDKPYLLPAGVAEMNGEEVLYYVETVTGHLYRFIPSINRLDFVTEFYTGTGYRMDAIPYFKTLKPEVIGQEIYFHCDGMIRACDLTTGIVTPFGPDQELIPWN